MKKIALIVMGLLVMTSGVLYAEELAVSESTAGSKKSGTELVRIGSSTNRMSQLERRIDSLEREIRSQNDSIRGLERDLNDLRRRR